MSAPPHAPANDHGDLEGDLQDPQPPARIHRTHVNATAVDSYKALSLKSSAVSPSQRFSDHAQANLGSWSACHATSGSAAVF